MASHNEVVPQSRIERIGVSATQFLFVKLGFIFREQPIEDYGIDAHIEIVEDDKPTGKLIALQIKSGESFFAEKTNNCIVFRGELKHLSYWLSHSLPVMLVIYDVEEEIAYWQIVNEHTITKTTKDWKLHIPLTQKINTSSVNLIKQFAQKLSAIGDYKLSFQDSANLLRKSKTERIGVAATQLFFAKLGFIFREQPIEDYGIDAHIEVIEDDKATGKLIALQIKATESLKITQDSIVFHGKLKHLSYWVSHSLPVILLIYDVEKHIAYWQIVNKHTITKTKKHWKLHIPLTQKIDSLSVDSIKQFAKKLSALNDYTILSFRDVSHGIAKRYSANILLNKEYSKPEIVSMVKKITEELKNREYYRSHLIKQHWKGKNAQVVWLHLYLSLDDLDQASWICQSQWIDKHLNSKFAPSKIEGEDIGGRVILKWKDEYEETSTIFDSFKLTKEDFLEKLDNILLPTKNIVEQVILLTEKYERGEVEETNYINEMKKLEVKLTELYFEATDFGLAPSECADLSQQFQNVMAIAHNIVLPFFSMRNGLKTWKKSDRNRLISSSIKDYQKELLKLDFELEKVHR